MPTIKEHNGFLRRRPSHGGKASTQQSICLRAKQQQRHEPGNHDGKASANEPGQHSLSSKASTTVGPNIQTTDSSKASANEPSQHTLGSKASTTEGGKRPNTMMAKHPSKGGSSKASTINNVQQDKPLHWNIGTTKSFSGR